MARPVALTAKAEGESAAALAWTAGTGSTPTGYAIYRNGVKVGETANTAYTDTKLVRGTYTYTVQALYNGNHASTLSDTALVSIVKGEPYFAPTQLQAAITLNKHVTLGWQQPDALLKQPATLRYDKGQCDDALGYAEGGYFFAGVAFDADDLAPTAA